MSFFSRLVRRLRNMIFADTNVGEAFGVELISSADMQNALERWDAIFRGRPSWVDPDDGVETINMAKHIADTRAKLTTLDINIALSGSPRADYLQTLADQLMAKLPDQLTDANALGGLLIRWNGDSWDYLLPGEFAITHTDGNGAIQGAILPSYIERGNERYTRLEYHRFEGETYKVTNKAFKNKRTAAGTYSLGREVPLSAVEEWAEIAREVEIENVDTPLFAFFRLPGSNTVDRNSPLGLSVFSNAIGELKAIDIAISRKNDEVEDSKHITFVNQQALRSAQRPGAHGEAPVKLPRFVKGLGLGMDDKSSSAVHEHTATLLTEERIKDINFNLSLAGVKCGFSEGVFVLDGQTGMITATQVEADDRDTIQTVKADRDALKNAVTQAMKGADALTTLYSQAPLGEYEITFDFADLTYNYEEDKAAWKSYVTQGWMPKWLYFVKFEGMSEEEAKMLIQEAESANQSEGLFDKFKG